MKAAIFHGKGNIRIEDVTPAVLKPGEVRVQIAVALTCGTDLKVVKRGYHAKMLTPPSPFGHELAGTICEIADTGGVPSAWNIGDPVVVANSAPCGACFFCRNRQENLCDDLQFLNGAYAETIAVPERFVKKNMVRLKPETAFEDAALAEPLACVVQGVEDLNLKSGQSVLVLGAGPIGLMFVALAKHLGCHVSVAGRGSNRLRAALRLGAERVFDAGKEGNIIQAVTGHAGDETSPHTAKSEMPAAWKPAATPRFDVVIEAIGKPETWEAAVRLVRKGGAVNFFGGCPGGATVSLDTHTLHYSSLKLLASFHHTPRTFRRALEFIEAGVIRARDFVDGEWPLTKLPELFQQMAAGNHAIKTLVRVRQHAGTTTAR
ncbi:MAG TPA: zinc-binding dehydrogenase [Verrucomicrobiae bacterium]|nr:zinc-binding dehydrogenase [Verrucomicrobiae bacterium]